MIKTGERRTNKRQQATVPALATNQGSVLCAQLVCYEGRAVSGGRRGHLGLDVEGAEIPRAAGLARRVSYLLGQANLGTGLESHR